MADEAIKKHILSKSSFLRGCQCTKALHLYKYNFDLKDSISPAQQVLFDRGNEVGQLARKLFPEGVDASPSDSFRYSESVLLTQELLDKYFTTIYEATFQYEGVLAASDILINDNGKWKCYEVKSSTEVKDINILDAALQYYVLTGAGIKLNDISIIYVNNQYIRKGDLELNQLFISESVKDKVLELQPFVKEKIRELKLILNSEKIPTEDIGTHCSDPYDCDFVSHCWKHIPEVSIFDLTRLNSNKKFELYKQNIIELQQLPHDYKLTESQQLQVDSYLQQKTFIDESAIKQFISEITYPVYFMDFETFQSAIPMFNNSKPYQQVPFQYSLHLKIKSDEEPIHSDFLAKTNGVDPRIKFIEALLNDTKSPGMILVFNQAFEIAVLKQLASDFPQYADEIHERISRVHDLMTPFLKRWYYSPAMNGKYSIKSVLPALIPEMSYDGLEIADGATASSAFLNLYDNTDAEEVNKIRANLKKYCQLDTYAMVKLFSHLEQV